jgi:hypothetical protein
MRNYLAMAVACCASVTAVAQMGGGMGADMQQKMMALQQSAQMNKQQLMQYQWTETSQLTLKGEPKPQRMFLCQYGPDGSVMKTPIGAPPPDNAGGGRLRQRVVEKKKAEMKDYMEDVQALLKLYVPPNPQLMQQAMQRKAVTLSMTPGTGVAQVIFTNYAKPGDSMTIGFDTNSKKIMTIAVRTYMDAPQDGVTLNVTMGTLPDGTSYAQQTVLNAQAKQLMVTTNSYNFAKK